MKKIILILIVLTAILSGCNKNDQMLKKIYGDYTLKTYTVDGVDSLSLYNDSLGLSFYFFYEDVYEHNVCEMVSPRKDGKWSNLYCKWTLKNNYKTFSIYESIGTTTGTGPFGDGKLSDWEILRLSRKEFKMKTIYNGKEYQIELE
jgi:hypothetical protein